MKRFESEMAAGDKADLSGSNPHTHQSYFYTDLGRRFVPQYKYTGVSCIIFFSSYPPVRIKTGISYLKNMKISIALPQNLI